MLMTEELCHQDSSPSKPTLTNSKAKEPDIFDSSDPKKLNNFILLCNLYFRNNSAYSKDNTKITFALTHLWGTALENFKPMLMSDDALVWEDDWQEFISILCTQFGPIDLTADAKDNIDTNKKKKIPTISIMPTVIFLTPSFYLCYQKFSIFAIRSCVIPFFLFLLSI